MTLQRSMIVSSGPSIIDVILNIDVDRDEDGRFVSMAHLLGAKCPCKPDKVLARSTSPGSRRSSSCTTTCVRLDTKAKRMVNFVL